MKHLKTIFACLLVTILSIGQVWADDLYFEGFETNHRTSGNNSYAAGPQVYGDWSLAYADAVTSGSPLTGTAHVLMRVAKNTTNSPSLTSGALLSSNETITKVSWNCKGVATQTLTVSYSTDGSTWTEGFSDVMPTAKTAKEFTLDDVAGPIYLKFVVSVSSSTGSNRDANIDDIKIEGSTSSGGGSGETTVLQSIAVSGTPTKTEYYAGQDFDPAGLTVTGTYDQGDPQIITSNITWSYNPSQTLALNQTSIGVTATVSEISSLEYNVTGLTVAAAPVIVSSVESIEDGGTYYIRGVRGSGATIEYLKFTDGTAGSSIAGTSASSTDDAIAITFSKVSDGVYQLVTPQGLYVTPGTSNGKIALSTSATTCTLTNTTKTWDNSAAIAISITSGSDTWSIQKNNQGVNFGGYKNSQYDITLVPASAPAVAKPVINGEAGFVTSTEVSISCTTDGASIYYTTDGTTPTASSTAYSAPFIVNADGTTTVKAIAVKGSDVSAVAEKAFTKVEALTTMAEVQAAAEGTEKAINVVISNWVVTGVSGSYAWISDADNTKGIMLYKSSHGFTAGKKLNGTVVGTKIQLYNLFPELKSLVSTDVTVTDATAITPRVTTIAALTSGHPAEQGTVVKLEGVTYSSSTSKLSDGVNSIAADNKLFSSLALVDGTTYDITGVVTYYKESEAAVVKIAPRSAADVEAQTPVVTPTAANLAALKTANRGTYILTLTNAVVTYVNGNNAFIEDATGGALIYFASHGYSAGDCLNGDYQVVTTDYQGKFEITAMEPQTGAAKTTAEIPLTTVTIATLNANFSSYESRRIKIVGANVTDAIKNSDRNGAISDGAELAVYAAVASTITLTQNDNVDIIGFPGFHNSDQQLNVWAQEDITVNVKEDPELAYSPATQSIAQGDAWSAPSLVNPHSVTIASYASNNESVATVTDGGVIALAGGLGTAVITAHFNGDATYSAADATYTITVNEAGTYSMSFNLTKACYDEAAAAEVVWNSNVVTMTATKNGGTNVNNYLGGSYAETRLYNKNILSFAPKTGVTITKVEWMSTANTYASKLVASTWTNASAAVDDTNNKLVVITPSASGDFSVTLTDGIRATAATVYYSAESEKSKLTASIDINNINMAVGNDDILLSDIAATSNPNKKAISYAVTNGSEYVSITGEGAAAAFHAIAEGTATISATIPNDLGNYTGATTTFNIIVAAAAPTLESIAIGGTATELTYTAGQHFNPAGLTVTGTYSDASTAPITEGITWAYDPDPLTEGTTSVSVTATVGEINSPAFVVNGLTVAAAPAPTSKKVVIIAEFDSKLYAMSNTVASKACAAIEVEKDGSNLVVSSTEDKAAVQWLMTTSGDDVTLQDADDNYLSASSGDLSVAAAVANWSLTQDGGYYLISMASGRALMYRNTNVFKHYSTGNTDGYAKVSEIFEVAEGATNIVISSKVNPQLAYNPASVEITVGDAWSAPSLGYVEGFDGLASISYESSNEAVATVTEGVIALAGGTGTATITATFTGNANYLAGSATYTIKVKEVADNCDATDDFSTANSSSPTSYTTRTTTAGWGATNAGYKVINDASYLMINGKTTAVGVITSPVLSDGIASLKFRYANTNNESNGVSVRIDIKQGTEVVKTYTLTKANSEVTKDVVYTEIIENINVAGEFQIIFTNLSPSNNTGNADRVSIGRLCWTNYSSAPAPVYTEVRSGLSAGNYYTICNPQKMTAIQGATLWSFIGSDANFAYIVQEDAPFVAGRPYIMYATAAKVEAVLEGEDAEIGSYNGLHGTSVAMNQAALNAAGDGIYLVIGNSLCRVDGGVGNSLPANRAYVVRSEVEELGGAPDPKFAPAHKVRKFALPNNTPTDISNIGTTDQPTKMMIDGQLFILRDGKMFDATGRLVK